MNAENSVIFKGNKQGLVIMLDEEIPYENLKYTFKEKILTAKNFFGSSNTSIAFKGRDLSEEQEEELLDIIVTETGLKLSFVGERSETSTPDCIISDNVFFDPVENITHYHKGSIRSGQSINFDGSIVIIGDVNPGGIITACGNIIILGSLRGFVYAGSAGDESCFISAFDMKPTQLRIGSIISYIPSEIATKSKKKPSPSIAFIEEGKIYIKPLI